MTEKQCNQMINLLTELLDGINEVKNIFAEMKQESVKLNEERK